MRKSITNIWIGAFFLLLTLSGLQNNLKAQTMEPPIPIEFLFGNKQMHFQMMMKKTFAPDSRLGFFTIATYSVQNQDFSDVDITIPVLIYYNFWKGFSAVVGTSLNSLTGFSPQVGIQHNYASRQILAVTVASININTGCDLNILGIYEYKPPINETWSLYNRVQFMYNFSMKKGTHNRSYLNLRTGVKRKSLTFGFGANLDQYGPYKTYADNYGVFIMREFR